MFTTHTNILRIMITLDLLTTIVILFVCLTANMEYKSLCNATHNAVCRCKAGYECQDKFCKDCVPIRTTTKPTLPPSTTGRIPLLQAFSQIGHISVEISANIPTLFVLKCVHKLSFLFWVGVDIGHLSVSI